MTSQDIPRARIPIRTCVGCRQRATASELLRVTVGSGADGEPVVVADPQGIRPGRGAHVHPTAECHDLAVRRKAFGRALRVSPGILVAPMHQYLQHAPDRLPHDPVQSQPDHGQPHQK